MGKSTLTVSESKSALSVFEAASQLLLGIVTVVLDAKSWGAHETGGASVATWADFEPGGASPTTWADLET